MSELWSPRARPEAVRGTARLGGRGERAHGRGLRRAAQCRRSRRRPVAGAARDCSSCRRSRARSRCGRWGATRRGCNFTRCSRSRSAGVTAIIYAIGWGPTLAIGYAFVIAGDLEEIGSRVWKPALGWTIVGIACGQAVVALGWVSTLRRVSPRCTGSARCRRSASVSSSTCWARRRRRGKTRPAELHTSEVNVRPVLLREPAADVGLRHRDARVRRGERGRDRALRVLPRRVPRRCASPTSVPRTSCHG